MPTEEADEVATRVVAKFSWTLVDPSVVRALLEERGINAYGISGEELYGLAERHIGSAGGKAKLLQMTHVLKWTWLPVAPAALVKDLALIVQSIVAGPDRTVAIRTKADALDFLNRRNLTKNVRTNLVKAFLQAHKERQTVEVRTRGGAERAGPIRLRGAGIEGPAPWRHQVEAREGLDRHLAQRGGEGTLVVLPTGSGKTETLASWLLDRLDEQPEARVLWVVHQQELVDQALERFQACALCRPEGFERRARAIHAGGSPIATLAEPDLDIASITIQTLSRAVRSPDRSKVDSFLKRPTFVVVDEAHHAAAPTYCDVLDVLDVVKSSGPRALVGLTATPWPASMRANRLLRERFPYKVIDVGAEELVRERILARPVLHTVVTGVRINLDAQERSIAEQSDFTPGTLARLDTRQRNDEVVRSWVADPNRWGKTLLFALNIEHADEMAGLLDDSGAEVRAIHSRSVAERSDTLAWFRAARGNVVLVSVGMLNEGVDLPDAKTAFLARPTASRILLRQMIGRVLRGPASGGEAEAHVVWFQDGWEDFGEVLDPAVVLPAGSRRSDATGDGVLPEIADDGDTPIPSDVVAEIAVQLSTNVQPKPDQDGDGEPDEGWVPVDPMLVSSRLVGYYELGDRRLPVFDHQQASYAGLLAAALAGDLRGRAHLAWFDDIHPPHPSKRGLLGLVELTRELGEAPPFLALDAVVGPGVAADRLRAAGRLDEEERAALVRQVYESTIASVAYRTLALFEEAVERELRERRLGRLRVERPPTPSMTAVPLRPEAERALAPRWHSTLAHARRLLPPEIRIRLVDDPPVSVEWTTRVVGTSWGHWSIKLRGRNRGRQAIRVNRLLSTTEDIVSHELLEYLLYHELLLPGEGHDAEFYELESLWPGRDDLDLAFATFHERWDTRPKSYGEASFEVDRPQPPRWASIGLQRFGGMGGPSYGVTFAPTGLVNWYGAAFGDPIGERSATAEPAVFVELADLCDQLGVVDWAGLWNGEPLVNDIPSTVLTAVAADGSTTVAVQEGSSDPPGMWELVDRIEDHVVALGWTLGDRSRAW